jgi:hypothetical protein
MSEEIRELTQVTEAKAGEGVFVRFAHDGTTVGIEMVLPEVPWDVYRAREHGEGWPSWDPTNSARTNLKLIEILQAGKVIEVLEGARMRYYRVTEPSPGVKVDLKKGAYANATFVEPASAKEVAEAVVENRVITFKQLPLTTETRMAVSSMWYKS